MNAVRGISCDGPPYGVGAKSEGASEKVDGEVGGTSTSSRAFRGEVDSTGLGAVLLGHGGACVRNKTPSTRPYSCLVGNRMPLGRDGWRVGPKKNREKEVNASL